MNTGIPTAVLSVLVQARGVSQTNAQLMRTQGILGATAGAGVRMGKQIAKGLKYASLGVLAMGAAAGKLAIEFDREMRNVNSIAQLSEKRFGKLREKVLALAGPTAQAPKTLAAGLYDLVSSGFSANEAVGILAKSARAATAGLTTTEISTKAVAAVLNAYHLAAGKAGDTSDVLFEIVNRGVISFEELASQIGDVLPFSASLDVNLREVGASIATMTKAGISAPETMTRIKAVMVTMLKPGKELSGVIKELGYESGSAMVKQLGFQGTLNELAKATGGSKDELAGLFPNIRALGGALALTGENSKVAAEDIAGMKDAAGATAKALSQQEKSISFQWNKLKATAEALAIGFGQKLLPELSKVMDIITNPNLTAEEKVTKVFDLILDGARAAFQKTLQLAGQYGPKLIGALVTSMVGAWWEMNPLEKLFTVGALIRVFGGKGAVTAAGMAIGRMLGLSIAAGTAQTAAATAAAGGASGALTTVAGGGAAAAGARWLGTDAAPKTAATLGAYGEKAALASTGLIGGATLSDKLRGGLKKWGARAGAFAGGYFATELGLSIGKKFGMGDPTEGQGIGKSLVHGFNTDQVADTEKAAMKIGRASEKAFARVQTGEGLLRSGMITRWKDIASVSAKTMKQIGLTYEKGGREDTLYRNQVAKNMTSVVKAIRAGMKAGVIDTKAGQDQIRKILHQRVLLTGKDPLKIAEGFKKSWVDAGALNNQQIGKIERQLAKMPKGARESATNSVVGMAKAWAKGHPKLEAQVKALQSGLITRFGKTNKNLKNGVQETVEDIGGFFAGMVNSVSGYLESLGTNVNAVLKALGLKKTVNFSVNVVKAAGKAVGAASNALGDLFSGEQRGGYIVPGRGSGDQFRTMLPAGSYVLNREATNAYGFNRGGMVPVELEPGERAFTPREVRSMGGVGTLDSMNRSVSRFQKGGEIGKPQMAGPAGPLRDMGQAAADSGYQAAIAYIKKHRPKAGPGGPLGSAPGELGAVERLASQFGLTMTSGLRPGDSDSWHSKNRARDFSNGVSTPQEFKFGEAVAARWGSRLLELIHTPLGYSIDNGKRVAPFAQAEHYDHVHVAMQLGGLIQRLVSGGLVDATVYGFGEPGTGTNGYKGDYLPGHQAYAELGMGTRLGELPYKHMLKISRAGKSVLAPKLDIGAGAAGAEIDLWSDTARALGLSSTFSGKVRVEDAAGGAGATGLTDAQKKANEGKARKANYERRLKALQKEVGEANSDPAKVSKLWKLMKFWGSVGIFDKDEKAHVLESVQNASAQTKPGGTLKVLQHLSKYASSHGEITGQDPSNFRDLTEAMERAQKRGERERKRTLAKRAAAQARKASRIAGKGKFEGLAKWLGAAEGNYNRANQDAERLVALEPEDLGNGYVDMERGAWGNTLGSLATWRDRTVISKNTAGYMVETFEGEIKKIQELQGKAFQKHKWKLAPLRDAVTNGNSFISELTDNMQGFQGYGGPQTVLGDLGEASPWWLKLGGPGASVFDTQNTIRELGLKGVGGGSSANDSERADMLQELLRQANQRTLVAERQFDTFKQFKGSYAGMFAKGGVLGAGQWGIAGERGPEPVVGPARIVSNEDAFGGGQMAVIVNGDIVQEPDDPRDPVELVLGDRRFAPAVQKASREGRGTGRRTPGGK